MYSIMAAITPLDPAIIRPALMTFQQGSAGYRVGGKGYRTGVKR